MSNLREGAAMPGTASVSLTDIVKLVDWDHWLAWRLGRGGLHPPIGLTGRRIRSRDPPTNMVMLIKTWGKD